ncbi:LLM class flavin-dependent oxidoreductase [Curtobacterium sp. MCSS17_006]|uniref:LLM class flavin-dependent oxidoreductase n=1 Tax=Curtobacterium sp. MCSS17_006 TaxID=2175642 RepID=UPI001C64F9B7|nr:LLM class flavin-dependent oxidoreductase [Curtobacterium sp. MCSS17_006]
MTEPDRITLVTALQGAGWHPGAWRAAGPAAHRLTSLRHWRDVVVEQDRLGIDAVTLEDSFTAGPTDPDGDLDTSTVVGRLDALLVANAVAPATRAIGLVPTVSVTHTEPFHVATGLQTLDHVSLGRAGWRIQVSPTTREAALFGRRPGGDDAATLSAEAREAAEVVSRLWDSWDDDAIVRDVTTGRFIDRDRIHDAAFSGSFVSVHGASIVPRSPQGRPPVFALAHRSDAAAFAVDAADVVLVTPGFDGLGPRQPVPDRREAAGGPSWWGEARDTLALVRDAEQAAGSDVRRPVLADLAVLIGSSPAAAADELAALDAAAGAPYAVGSGSDTSVLATTVPDLVARIADLRALGYAASGSVRCASRSTRPPSRGSSSRRSSPRGSAPTWRPVTPPTCARGSASRRRSAGTRVLPSPVPVSVPSPRGSQHER